MITAVDTNILLDVLIPGADGMKTRFRVRKLCEDWHAMPVCFKLSLA
jgi:hypothetical protein